MPLERMKDLVVKLDEAARAYYQENRELISNYEYDALYAELEALERETGVRLSGSPTGKVGYEVVGSLVKVAHETPMLSLDKTKETEKLMSFLGEQTGLLSWKLDGLTIALKYENGKLQQAVTRGNGHVGEDVTHTARVFINLPLSIPFTGALSVRGEAVIGNTDFERINEAISEPGEKYKNPRNLCSGTVRQLNSEIAAARRVRFYAFDLISAAAEIPQAPPSGSKLERMRWLAGQGFETVAHMSVTRETAEAAAEDFKHRAAGQNIASDGLVLTYDSIPYSESLGATSKFPRDSIAFKWADEIYETAFDHVEWNTSRTGLINPVAVFEPVEIDGTDVSRASLHNVSIMRGFQLGRGDRVTVYKANMIIPQLAENLTRSDTEAVPEICPVCSAETEVVGDGETDVLYCLNPNCRAQLVTGLSHFAGRDAMNIEGLSEQTLEKFTEQGMVNDYSDIFTLAQFRERIIGMDGFGEKSYGKLMASIEKCKETPLPNFLYALGIKHVGLANAKLLCNHFYYNIDKIIETVKSADGADELLSIKGFGEVIAHSLRVYFSNDENIRLLRNTLPLLRFPPPPPELGEGREKPLGNLIFVITGEVNHFAGRKEMQAFIERGGGRVTGSVTAKTSYLINNSGASGSAKNKKAAELGVPVLTEEMFLEKFGMGENTDNERKNN